MEDHEEQNKKCVVCENCNVGEVLIKMPLGDRVSEYSKTPLTDLLSEILNESVTPETMLCSQCLLVLNKKDKLMLLERESPGQKPKRGGRGRQGSRGGRGACKVPGAMSANRGSRGRGRGRGRGRKLSSSTDVDALPMKKFKSDQLFSDNEIFVKTASSDEIPCITTIKEEISSDCEAEAAEICINSDALSVNPNHVEPEAINDFISTLPSEPLNYELIKSEILVDGDESVVPVRCIDENEVAEPRAVHVVCSTEESFPTSSLASISSDDNDDSFLDRSLLVSNASDAYPHSISVVDGSTPIQNGTDSVTVEINGQQMLDHGFNMETERCIESEITNTVLEVPSFHNEPSISTIKEEIITVIGENGSELLGNPTDELPDSDVNFSSGSIFSCNLCSSSFTTAEAMRQHHVKVHNKLRRVQCNHCSFFSSEFTVVEDHMKNVHQVPCQHFCKFCDAAFILMELYKNHIKVVHKAKPKIYDKIASYHPRKRRFVCPICKDSFISEKELSLHNKMIHGGQKYQCESCSFKCTSLKTLSRHDAAVHKKSNMLFHACTECKMEFGSEILLEQHCIDAHDCEKTQRCNFCGDVFATSSMLKFHKKQHNPFCCPFCNLGFKKRENMNTHLINVHNNDLPNLKTPSVDLAVQSTIVFAETPSINPDMSSSVALATDNFKVPSKLEKNGHETSKKQRNTTKKNQVPKLDSPTRPYDQDVAREYLKTLRGTAYNVKVECIFCSKEITAGHIRAHFKRHAGEAPYACQFCDKVGCQSTNMRKHMRTKHPELFHLVGTKTPKKKPVQCEFCDQVFVGVDECETHLWEHMTQKNYECSHCKSRFGSMNNLKEHFKTHYFQERKVCPHCQNRKFINIGFYNEHLENCKNQWKCPICSNCCMNENSYRKHLKFVHGSDDNVKYVCPEPDCGREFFEKHRYDDHCITHDTERRFQCPQCPKKFKRRRPMVDHIKYKHDGARCSTCDMAFVSLEELIQHRSSSHLSSFHHCPECAFIFVNESTLLNHIKCCHPDDEIFDLLQCPICDELSANDAELSQHIILHREGKYCCSAYNCYHYFLTDDECREHISAFHSDFDYSCVYCQSDLHCESALQKHYIEFHGKELKCKLCLMSFYKDEHLERHMSHHSEEARYLCDACDFSCTNRSWLVSHIKMAHNVSSSDLKGCVMKQRVFGCSLCDNLTITEEETLEHLLTHGEGEAQLLQLVVPTKLEADSMLTNCPVCDVPWPDRAAIADHLTTSKVCADQLALGQEEEETHEGGEKTNASEELQYVLVDDDSEGNVLLALNDSMLVSDESGKSNGAVVEVNGEKYVLFQTNDEQSKTSGDIDDQQEMGEQHLVTDEHAIDNGQPFSMILDSASQSDERSLSAIVDEQQLVSLINSSKQVIFAHEL